MKTTTAVSPFRFKPARPEDFIGPAREVATQLQRTIAHAVAHGFEPIKYFLTGSSGVGKTALTDFAITCLGVSHWAVQEFNGTDITIDRVRELESTLHLTVNEMFGDWRVIAIHEADRMTEPAQVKMLTVLDNLPGRTALFCTTNKELKQMETRFQRRFKSSAVRGPDMGELADWLRDRWGVPAAIALNIAMEAGDNVALALTEAEDFLINHPTAADLPAMAAPEYATA